ncbi:MAG: amidase family protein [Geodermatophilaceae bacterium]
MLEGIPVLLKDNIDTADQGATAGSEALLLARPDDAELVQRLRAAGAVIIGKANLSEWANFRDFNSTSGWSAVGGQTNNPYVLDRNPCGSSSGSGAGVAASLAVVAIGTETDGSIVCPAGQNGVVGHKPTLGLVSGDGVVPISSEQDTAGPMARNVTDAAIVLDVIDGAGEDYTDALDPGALQGARIGVWTSATGDSSPEVDALFQETIARLQQLGATTVEVEPPLQDRINANEFPALLVEFADEIDRYLAATPGPHPNNLAQLIAFNRLRAETELRYFGQDIFELALATGGDVDDPAYQRARLTATRSAQTQHQQHAGQVQPRRDRRTDEQPGVADHSGRGRRVRVRVVRPGRGGRLSERVGADGLCRCPADRYVGLRWRRRRRHGARSRLRLGASDAGTPASDLPSDDRLIRCRRRLRSPDSSGTGYPTMKDFSVSVWLPLDSMASTSTLYSVPGWRNSGGTVSCRVEAGRSTLSVLVRRAFFDHQDLVADDVHGARGQHGQPANDDGLARLHRSTPRRDDDRSTGKVVGERNHATQERPVEQLAQEEVVPLGEQLLELGKGKLVEWGLTALGEQFGQAIVLERAGGREVHHHLAGSDG